MARIKYGSIVSDVSGSVGSATFQKSLYGNTLRNKPRPHKTASSAQLSARSIMMQCQYSWQSLSTDQRKQWDQYIAFSGQTINRDRTILSTGHSLFLKYNFHKLLKGDAVVTSLIYGSAPNWPIFDYVGVSSGYMSMVFSANLNTLDVYPTIFLSSPRNPSQSFSMQGLRFMKFSSFDPFYVTLATPYLNVFGALPVPGSIVHYKLVFWSRTSPIMSAVQTGMTTILSI